MGEDYEGCCALRLEGIPMIPVDSSSSLPPDKPARVDPRAELRGKWDVDGNWWCDCPNKRPDTRRFCKRCGIFRPLKGAPLYHLRDPGQGAGFMYTPSLVPVKPTSK